MPEPLTVWAIRLGHWAGEVRGTLALEEREIVFAHDKGARNVRIPLASVRRVRRLFASPVLLVDWHEEAGPARVAFYFAQPPPLEDPAGGKRRKHRRQSAQYLVAENAARRGRLKEWRRAIAAAVREASQER